jgi:uridine kinase
MPPGGSPGRVIGAVAKWRADHPGLLVVAIDGHGAAGKSTLADAVAAATGAALVRTDDFFLAPPGPSPAPPGPSPAPPGPSAARPGPSPARPGLAGYYDWRRLRAEALVPLRKRRAASFRRFDWERGSGLDGTVSVEPRDLILVEGVFSSSPELSDLVERSVFVDTPEPERLRRLHLRVTSEEWDDKWLIAERAYFELTRTPLSFDLVVPGTGPAGQVSAR